MRQIIKRLAKVAAIVIMSVLFVSRGLSVSATVPGNVTLVSENISANGQGGNGHSTEAKITRFGEAIVFVSAATNLVASDTNGKKDVFIKFMETGVIERVSKSTAGVEADADSNITAISSTGRFVAFKSTSTNLIDGETQDGRPYQYLRDTVLNTTTYLNVGSNPDYVTFGGISDDGRFILIEAAGNHLAPGITLGGESWHVYIYDVENSTYTIVDKPLGGGTHAVNAFKNSTAASMSCDGAFVAFRSETTNTSINDNNGYGDIFIADLRNGVKITNITSFTDNQNFAPNISCDGRYLAFTSYATNIDGSVPSGNWGHLYRYDRFDGSFDLVDQSSGGALANSGSYGTAMSMAPTVTDKGDVIFVSDSTNLISGYSGITLGTYIRKVDDGITETLSVKDSGNVSTTGSKSVLSDSVTADGRYAAIIADDASGMLTGDTNGYKDILLVETGL